MMLHLSNGPTLLNLCVCPLLKLRANHSPNPGLRKSLIFGGTSAWKSKKSEKSKMSNRLTFEFAVKVRKSTIRELQASRRELLVQLAHKTYEPAREKAEELTLDDDSLGRKTLYACECHGSCLPRSCAIRGITAHVPHTSDVGSLRGNVEDFERGSPKRFDWLCRFSVSDSGPFWTSRIGYAT